MTPMAGEPLWDRAKDIMSEMRDLIQSGSEERVRESHMGWQYPLLNQCKAMKAAMEARDYRVRDCTVFHFVLAMRIENPTKRLLLVPIQGSSNFGPAETLSPGSYWDIKDEAARVLTPNETSGADMVIITLDGDGGQNNK